MTTISSSGTLKFDTNGSVSAPNIFRSTNDTTGIFFPGDNSIRFSSSGSEISTIVASGLTSTNLTASVGVFAPVGTVSAPGYSFTSDTNTGIYNTANELHFALNGVNEVSFQAGSVLLPTGNNIQFQDDTATSSVNIKGPASQTAPNQYTLVLPNAQGALGESLINNGSGILTWGAPISSVNDLSNGLTSGTSNNTNIIRLNFSTNSTSLGDTGGSISGSNNTLLGDSAGNNLSSGGSNNTFIGSTAGTVTTTGGSNTVIGSGSNITVNSISQVVIVGTSTTATSAGSTAIGHNITSNGASSVAIGLDSGTNGTEAISIGFGAQGGNNCIAIGTNAGQSTAGANNIMIGENVLGNGTSAGSDNIVLGRSCLTVGSSASSNVLIGTQIMAGGSSGSNNVILGNLAGQGMNSSSFNVIAGANSGLSLASGNFNVIFGSSTAQSLNGASDNIILGRSTCPLLVTGTANVSIGQGSSIGNTFNNCIAIGTLALSATNSISIGNSAGTILGTSNISIGTDAGNGYLATCNNNIVLGNSAMNGTGGANVNNIAIGQLAMNGSASTVGATGNVAIGLSAGAAITTASNNILLGPNAGSTITTGNLNVILGSADVDTGARTNTICIGSGTTTNGFDNSIKIGFGTSASTRCYIDGINGITTPSGVAVLIGTGGQLGTIVSSRRYKDEIKSMDSLTDKMHNLMPSTFIYKSDISKRMQYGLIAEDVEKIDPNLVVYKIEEIDGVNVKKIETVRYLDLIPITLNMVIRQKNACDKKIASLASELENNARELDSVKAELAAFKSFVIERFK